MRIEINPPTLAERFQVEDCYVFRDVADVYFEHQVFEVFDLSTHLTSSSRHLYAGRLYLILVGDTSCASFFDSEHKRRALVITGKEFKFVLEDTPKPSGAK